MEDNSTYGFSKPDAESILGLIGGNEIVIPERNPRGDSEIRLAYTTAGATARSGTTCGSGTATLQNISDVGVIASASQNITFYNWVATAVGTNRYILVKPCGPVWVIVAEECPA
jgi:hypothetical protein